MFGRVGAMISLPIATPEARAALLVLLAVVVGEGVSWGLGLPLWASLPLRLLLVAASLSPLLPALRRRPLPLPDSQPSAPPLPPVTPFDPFRCGICIAEKIKYFGDFSHVMQKETSQVIKATEENAITLMNDLGEVETGLRRLLDYIVTSGSNERVAQMIERTESQLGRSQTLIEEFARERQQDIAAVQAQMEEVGRVVSDLSGTVDTVRGIARQTRMLALNAMIEAVRAGEAGQGFAVVADEVRSLSHQSDQAAVAIGAGIAHLEQAVSESLQSIVSGRASKEESGFAVISEAVSELTQNLQILISQQTDTLAKVRLENEQLSKPILQMIGSIQFQDIVKRQLEGLSQCFQEIATGIETTVVEMADPSFASLEEMNARYRARIDEMVRQALTRLEPVPTSGTTESAAIEMF